VAAPTDGQSLTVMTANLRFGAADADRVVELVRDNDVDVLAVQELTPPAVRNLREAGLEETLGESALSAEPGASGTGVYAAAPLDSTGLIKSGIGFGMQGARMQLGATSVAVVSVHPVPPTSPTTVERWRNALRALPSAGAADLSLLAGDFNATLDHDELREVLNRGYVDAADVTGDALTTTWSRPPTPPLTIDHVLADERIHVESTSVHELPGSDHNAVIAELVAPR
jgi:endonuclease/exonuclease/phosphatase family metal-dependent hydrolase